MLLPLQWIGSAEAYMWAEAIPTPVYARGHSAGKQPCRIAPGSPGGHCVGQKSAVCPCCLRRLTSILGCIRPSMSRRLREVIPTFYSALVQLHLECWVQFWASSECEAWAHWGRPSTEPPECWRTSRVEYNQWWCLGFAKQENR